jgi:hypothetical protein
MTVTALTRWRSTILAFPEQNRIMVTGLTALPFVSHHADEARIVDDELPISAGPGSSLD